MISQRLCLSLRALRERLAFHAKNARSSAKSQRNIRKLRHYPEILTRGNTLVFIGIVSNTPQLQENCTFRGPGARRFGGSSFTFRYPLLAFGARTSNPMYARRSLLCGKVKLFGIERLV